MLAFPKEDWMLAFGPVRSRPRPGNLAGSGPLPMTYLTSDNLMVRIRRLMGDHCVKGGHLGNFG
jgi:hypothetical protein